MTERRLPDGSLLLHIGPHKTGTTTIQAALAAHRDELRAQGVIYPGTLAHEVNPPMAVTVGRVDPGHDLEKARTRWHELVAEIDRAEPRLGLLSSEFYSEATPERIGWIIRELGRPVHVVVTLRPLTQILASQWQQYLQNDRTFTLDDWLRQTLADPVPGPPTPTFWSRHRHDLIVRRWAEVVGPENLTVVVVDDRDHTFLLRAFESLLGLAEGTLAVDDTRRNRSLTTAEIELLRVFNEQYDGTGWPASDYTRIIRYGAARRLQERPVDGTGHRVRTPAWAVARANEIGAQMAEAIGSCGVGIIGSLDWLSDPERAPSTGENEPVTEVDLELAAALSGAVIGRLASFRGVVPGPAAGPVLSSVVRRHRAVLVATRPGWPASLRAKIAAAEGTAEPAQDGPVGGFLTRWRGRLERRLRRPGRPTLSVIVPFYDVEAYLAECLDSILAQRGVDLEVILVDDGSPDGSRAIAEEYAARDPRLRVLTRPNGGLGAARNTGVRAARGRYLTFVDSDDRLPAGALAALVGSAERTGSDIVVGGVSRFDRRRRWTSPWVSDVHGEDRLGVRLDDYLPVLRNLYTWDKVFRTDFWRAQGLWFREGVAYEDQPIITQLLARASAIDVLRQPVYEYRSREDRSSISQQTATVADLRQRIEAWRIGAATLRAELSEAAYDHWLWTLFEYHFQWYLTSPGAADPTYWRELATAVRELAADAPAAVWEATRPDRRVLVRLAVDDRQADAVEFVRREGDRIARWGSTVREDGVLLHLPLQGDPALPDELFLLRPSQLRLGQAVERLAWEQRADGGVELRLSGWAYIRKVDLARHDQQVVVVLRNERTGEEQAHKSAGPAAPAFPPPLKDQGCDPTPGTYEVVLPVTDLTSRSGSEDIWSVHLRVDVAGLTVTEPVTRVGRGGSVGFVTAHVLADGSRLVPDLEEGRLRLRRDSTGVRVQQVALEGRTLAARLPAGHGLVRVEARSRRRTVEAAVTGDRLELTLPALEVPVETGRLLVWRLAGITASGEVRDLVAAELDAGAVATGRDTLVLGPDADGALVVRECALAAVADGVRVDDGRLRVRGRIHGGPQAPDAAGTYAAVELRHDAASTRGERVVARDGTFEAVVDLAKLGPLPLGDHRLWLVVSVGDAAGVSIPLHAGDRAGLPLPVTADRQQGRVVRTAAGLVQLTMLSGPDPDPTDPAVRTS